MRHVLSEAFEDAVNMVVNVTAASTGDAGLADPANSATLVTRRTWASAFLDSGINADSLVDGGSEQVIFPDAAHGIHTSNQLRTMPSIWVVQEQWTQLRTPFDRALLHMAGGDHEHHHHYHQNGQVIFDRELLRMAGGDYEHHHHNQHHSHAHEDYPPVDVDNASDHVLIPTATLIFAGLGVCVAIRAACRVVEWMHVDRLANTGSGHNANQMFTQSTSGVSSNSGFDFRAFSGQGHRLSERLPSDDVPAQ